jgi:hypothetical protein
MKQRVIHTSSVNKIGWMASGCLAMLLAFALSAGATQEGSNGSEGIVLAQSIAAPVTAYGMDPFLTHRPFRENEKSLIPVEAVDSAQTDLQVEAGPVADRRAFGFVVPAGSSMTLEIEHPQASWFKVVMVDKFGHMLPGTLQNLQYTGTPRASIKNTSDKPMAAYAVVYYPRFITENDNSFTLTISRNVGTY